MSEDLISIEPPENLAAIRSLCGGGSAQKREYGRAWREQYLAFLREQAYIRVYKRDGEILGAIGVTPPPSKGLQRAQIIILGADAAPVEETFEIYRELINDAVRAYGSECTVFGSEEMESGYSLARFCDMLPNMKRTPYGTDPVTHEAKSYIYEYEFREKL